VELRGTHHDPLDEIEVVRLLGATYIEADITSSRYRHLLEIPRTEFLPYQLGRNDDWAALDTSTLPLRA
jgi:hypothetical protein